MNYSGLSLLAAVFSGLNLVLVAGLAWRFGRWTGIVDTRLDHLDREHRAAGARRARADDNIERA